MRRCYSRSLTRLQYIYTAGLTSNLVPEVLTNAFSIHKNEEATVQNEVSPEMNTSAPVSFDDLLNAYEWVSSSEHCENEAYVSRVTGQIHWSSSITDVEEELPEDIEDGSIYLAVPHQQDLDLGRELAFRFVEEHLPEARQVVSEFFRQRGAYSRFKSLLAQRNQLESWYKYEDSAVEEGLREWSEENGLQLKP